jgi:hypothetical protein
MLAFGGPLAHRRGADDGDGAEQERFVDATMG